MTLQCERNFGGAHAASVVGHFDQLGAPRRKAYGDARGTSVDGVFRQFLQRAGGPLDNLAGGNSIDKMLWETAY
jgi:hypothetical protein